MEAKREFRGSDTHGVLQRFGADIRATSEGHGWSSIYASIQRENPFEGRFEAIADDLIVLHRSGPVQTTFASGGHVTSRCIPKGSIFFLPAGHACEVGRKLSFCPQCYTAAGGTGRGYTASGAGG